MRSLFVCFLACLILIFLGVAQGLAPAPGHAGAAKTGDVVFQAHFDQPAEQKAWSTQAFAQWAPGDENNPTILHVQVPPEQATRDRMIRRPFDLSPYRGYRLYFTCLAKAQDVTQPKQKNNGVKFMLDYNSAATGPRWINQNNVFGTFDWKTIGFTVNIPADATAGALHLGLQECSGTAWFKDLRVTVLAAPQSRPAPPANSGPLYTGHEVPRLRGVMSPVIFREDDIRVLGQDWKANLIRWQLQPTGINKWRSSGASRDLAQYDKWMDSKLDELDKVLDACQKYGIKVVIDLHELPGGRDENNDLLMLHEAKYQDHFVALWEKIARRFKDNPAVWAYDLCNEPVETQPPPEGVGDYLGAQARAAKAIRAIDPKTTILIEVDQWDSPESYAYLSPVDIPNVVYEVHMYWPHQFTHQGLEGPMGVNYPGKINGQMCDKEALRQYLQPVRDFQLAYHVQIYVGEFGAVRWAPDDSAEKYLSDCIDLFEEYGWDWSYHAYREYDGWSVEHGPDRYDTKPATQPTSREQLLLGWFAKNQKPAD